MADTVASSSTAASPFYCSPLYGGSGGDGWTEGPYSGITRIIMTANEYSLTSVQLQYVQEGNVSSKRVYRPGRSHGGLVGPPHPGALGDRIEYSLNYPEEILTKISGHFGSYKPPPESWTVIKSLTFHTNKGKYGPFGQEDGTPFETEEGGKIVGFLGSSGTLVDSIGVYMQKPLTSKDEARENGESKDGVYMPKPITSKEEAGENGENKDGVYVLNPTTSKDEASENGENKDDQIMPPVISPNWIWTKAPQISGIWTKLAQLCRIWTKVGQLFRIWTKVAQFLS